MVNVFSKLVGSNYFTPAVVGAAAVILIARHYWSSNDEHLHIPKINNSTLEKQANNLDANTTENLLHKNRNFEPEYEGYLSNHLSMGIISMQAMNSDQKQVEEFYNVYVERLEPVHKQIIDITIHNWKKFRGFEVKGHNFYSLSNFFAQEHSRLNLNHLLGTYLPDLLLGSVGAAFHGLIQTGYAVSSGNAQVIADGLAYFTMSYQPIGNVAPKPKKLKKKHSLADYLINTLDRIKNDNKMVVPAYARNYTFEDTMAVVSSSSHVEEYDIDFSQFEQQYAYQQIGEALIHLYRSSKYDFFALHAVTGFYALLQLLPFVYQHSTQMQVLSTFWRAVNITYVMRGTPDVKSLSRTTTPSSLSWEYLNKSALDKKEHPDQVHIIKMVNALQQLEKTIGTSDIYKQAAFECIENH